MLESLRRRFSRESVTLLEYIIPRPHGAETRGIDVWDVRLSPGSVLPLAAVSWWAASPSGATDHTAVALVSAGIVFAGRSTIRWVRVRLR